MADVEQTPARFHATHSTSARHRCCTACRARQGLTAVVSSFWAASARVLHMRCCDMYPWLRCMQLGVNPAVSAGPELKTIKKGSWQHTVVGYSQDDRTVAPQVRNCPIRFGLGLELLLLGSTAQLNPAPQPVTKLCCGGRSSLQSSATKPGTQATGVRHA